MRQHRRGNGPPSTLARSSGASMLSIALTVTLAFAAPLGAQDEQARADSLGIVDFQVSCEPAVQAGFDRAVALLHHMMYQEARRAFEEIAQRDPVCAMAPWGAAREAEARMEALRLSAEAADEQRFATYIEADRLVLGGRIALAEGDPDRAVERTREGAELRETVEKHAVSPGSLLPAREALGDLLMELERPSEALRAYESSLEVWPNRYRSLLGAARAARSAGDERLAREHYGALLDVVAAESDRAGVREAEAATRGN